VRTLLLYSIVLHAPDLHVIVDEQCDCILTEFCPCGIALLQDPTHIGIKEHTHIAIDQTFKSWERYSNNGPYDVKY